MAIDFNRRALRIGRTVRNWSWAQRLVALAAVALIIYVLWTAVASVADGVRTARQTRRDEQHNANVGAQLGAADANANNAAGHEADRREAEGRHQEAERAVARARSTADHARRADEEATRRYETSRRSRTADLPPVSDDDVCSDLRSVGLDADGCREK